MEPNGFAKKCETTPDEINGVFTTLRHDDSAFGEAGSDE
jgi:hypothetical protein